MNLTDLTGLPRELVQIIREYSYEEPTEEYKKFIATFTVMLSLDYLTNKKTGPLDSTDLAKACIYTLMLQTYLLVS